MSTAVVALTLAIEHASPAVQENAKKVFNSFPKHVAVLIQHIQGMEVAGNNPEVSKVLLQHASSAGCPEASFELAVIFFYL